MESPTRASVNLFRVAVGASDVRGAIVYPFLVFRMMLLSFNSETVSFGASRDILCGICKWHALSGSTSDIDNRILGVFTEISCRISGPGAYGIIEYMFEMLARHWKP